MMKNYDESVEMNHDPNWPYIPDHPYRILIIGNSGSGLNSKIQKKKSLCQNLKKIFGLEI